MPARHRGNVLERYAPLQASDNLGARLRRLSDIDEAFDLVDRHDDIGSTNER